MLVALQSVSAQWRDRRLHRSLGRALFGLVPLFCGSAVLSCTAWRQRSRQAQIPSTQLWERGSGLHDLISTTVLVAMVCAALAWRRTIAQHAGYLLATVLLDLPPVVARLPIPRFFHSGELIAAGFAALVVWRAPKSRTPFLVLIAVQALQILMFETVGASSVWAEVFSAYSRQPVLPYAAGALLLSVVALWLAWTRAPGRVTQPRRRGPAI